MKLNLIIAVAALSFAACQSTNESMMSIQEQDAETRSTLFSAMSQLEGRWHVVGMPEEAVFDFDISSAGSVVREIMFPGGDEEMTNMYSLDGNAIVMTHYCAHGNQPHMRAERLEGDRLVFESVGVRDRTSEDEKYMGAMTLVFVDEGHIQQIWRQLPDEGTEEPVVIDLERIAGR